jgi:hypothetical protein
MKPMTIALIAAAAAGGCRTEMLPKDQPEKTAASTRNEQEAEETLRRSFQYLVDGNVDAAYQLICTRDRQKISLDAYRKGYEENKESLVRIARQARISYSGEASLPDGTPYVMVVVDVGQREIVPYSLIRETGGWRIILVDPRRSRQAKQ